MKTKPHLTDIELFKKLNEQSELRAYQDWQIIYSVQKNAGTKSETIAQILGISQSKIYRVIQLYNKFGVNWRIYGKWGGRRDARCHMSFEEESQILAKVSESALTGKILIYKHIKDIIETKIGKTVSDDYIWDLFKRHGWKKKVPRPSHPKADMEKQEEYKKTSNKFWQPNI